MCCNLRLQVSCFQVEFARQVISPLEFASGRTQVAAITYSNEALVQWHVSQAVTKTTNHANEKRTLDK